MIDGLNDTAHETAPWRRILNADRRGWVLIGACTSDTGVHVRRNAISMCAPALPYVAGCLTVVARPPERRRRSGALGRRWERPPPFWDASIGIAEGGHVHAHATLPGGVAPVPSVLCRKTVGHPGGARPERGVVGWGHRHRGLNHARRCLRARWAGCRRTGDPPPPSGAGQPSCQVGVPVPRGRAVGDAVRPDEGGRRPGRAD